MLSKLRSILSIVITILVILDGVLIQVLRNQVGAPNG